MCHHHEQEKTKTGVTRNLVSGSVVAGLRACIFVMDNGGLGA